jgi:ABC-type glycerol-3-phosphate transport system permease component
MSIFKEARTLSNTEVLPRRRSLALPSFSGDLPLNLILLGFGLLTYIPFYVVVISSFKNNTQFLTEFWLPSFPLHIENYTKAWPVVWRFLQNSFSYSIPTLILVLVISGLGGYGFARFRFFGKGLLFIAVLVLLMLPGILLVIPMFVQVTSWGWLNTPQAIILPWTAVDIVFGIFLMRTLFESMPKAYFEAARLDGANEFQLFMRIGVPMALPAFSTLAILDVLFTWNDIIWPLAVVLDRSKVPISIGALTFGSTMQTDYGALYAGFVLTSLPLVLLFLAISRRFMAGLQGGLAI